MCLQSQVLQIRRQILLHSDRLKPNKTTNTENITVLIRIYPYATTQVMCLLFCVDGICVPARSCLSESPKTGDADFRIFPFYRPCVREKVIVKQY